MRGIDRTAICALALLTGAWIGLGAQQAQQSSPAPQGVTPVPSDKAPGPEFFNGTWGYNADYSLNAATGRPEQNPKAANTRRPPGSTGAGGGGRGGAGGGGSNGSGTGGTGGTGSGGTGGYGGGAVVTAAAQVATVAAARAATRVAAVPMLAETAGCRRSRCRCPKCAGSSATSSRCPKILKIKVTDGTVSFTDDLDRERNYPSTGKKQHYQLGAASYDAKVHWEGNQLFREIEGARGFKMHETYFLSEDGKRLFVIIRVGDPPTEKEKEKGAQIVGVNRVYDRVPNGGGND